ncbi:IscA/HesB family protein [uncultured Desulfobacter sp.]|uniref:IscA/HesB family protein n=1 Tax=uncultured Desulfobacter sp. TaxID=240139 RepID=UPI002AABC4C3|nr:IscA/HesB family protein [uncultured Desulfobacter sp.]
MINVTKPAQEQVRMYFEGKELSPVRIFLNSGGCGGPSLAMALDEKQETDAVFTFDNVEYIMNKDLLEKASPVDIDFVGSGFHLESNLKPAGGCMGCSGGTCGS